MIILNIFANNIKHWNNDNSKLKRNKTQQGPNPTMTLQTIATKAMACGQRRVLKDGENTQIKKS